MTTTPLINKKKTIIPLRVQIANGTVLKSTHERNIRLNALPKEETKAHIFPYITSGLLILVAQLCGHVLISTFANTDVTIYNKQMEPQMKVP